MIDFNNRDHLEDNIRYVGGGTLVELQGSNGCTGQGVGGLGGGGNGWRLDLMVVQVDLGGSDGMVLILVVVEEDQVELVVMVTTTLD